MSTIRFIGDVHGRNKQYERIIKDCDRSVQVGDMGIGFFRIDYEGVKKSSNPSFDKMAKGNHRFIRGNHDNPQHCQNHPFCIPDGTFEDGVYHLGGAISIDKAYRTENIDWWSDEELSQTRLDIELELYKEYKPDIVVSHDCPESIARIIMDILNIRDKEKFPSRTRETLEKMFYHHQPKLWVFGHWHKTVRFNQLGCEFQCLGELEYLDIELNDFKRINNV